MQISDQIIAVLDDLCQRFGIVIDWSQQNLMPYIEDLCGRYIQYEKASSIAWCVIFAVLIALAGIVWVISWKVYKKNGYSDIAECITFVSMILFWIFLGVGVLVCVVQIFDIIACNTIPEKVIIEYVRMIIDSQSN